jgi:2-polyprenyl-3-methyl-5-hydroxy-6-metoxy-1,4-benzoquinol methylase
MTDRAATSYVCPSCGGRAKHSFYDVDGVSVHQVKLVQTRRQALDCAKSHIRLCFCSSCGFIWNRAFDPRLMRYGEDYESTQAVTPTFNAFHERLARDLIERYGLHGKQIIEIGCGQGEFLTLLAELGNNHGTGFDHVYRGGSSHPRVEFVKDYYAKPYDHLQPDFICCKMTLEHIHNTGEMLRSVRHTIGDRSETVVLFMVPEITRILKLRAFWDIYYEHCSYWSPGSLARAFRNAGFDPIRVWTDYNDQYVLIAARPGSGNGPILANEEPPAALARKVKSFVAAVVADQVRWRGWLDRLRRSGQKVVLWGGGSKGVAFLTTLDATAGVDYAVDINPRRHGTFIAGTGQKIVAPEFLREYQPDVVLVMSPIYLHEIQADLRLKGVHPRQVVTVESPEPLAAACALLREQAGCRNALRPLRKASGRTRRGRPSIT